jgi:hypothetical protein
MRKAWFTLAAVLVIPASTLAQGAKPCEDLKTEIAAKLDAKGVKAYSLDIVAKDSDAEGKVVGTCEAGSKKILYKKSAVPAPAATKDASKP